MDAQQQRLDGNFLVSLPNECGDNQTSDKPGLNNDDATTATFGFESSMSNAAPQNRPPRQCDYTREDITNSANDLIDHLNNKRKQDTQLIDDFKKILELQVQRACGVIEARMFHVYETQGKEIQSKIQELFACLERIAKLEAELAKFKEKLQILYKDMDTLTH